MARAIWTGVLTFGLVTVPVGLFTATEDHTVHFHQLQRGTGDRVRYKKVNERTGDEVDNDEIVKGYDLGGGEYVIVEPDELEEIAPGKSQAIEMAGFVDIDQVNPVHLDRTYYIAPQSKEYLKVYDLLRAALEESGKAGIATFTMRGKEYLTALRAQNDILILQIMHWADEIRDPHKELDVLPAKGRTKASSRERDTARRLIDALSMDWDPDRFHDTFGERVQALVDAKREGQEIVSEAGPPEATNVVDLMDALQRSVDQARSTRGRSGAEKPPGELHRLSSRRDDDTGPKKRQGKQGKPGKKKTGGTRASAKDLKSLSKSELYERATKAGIAGRSKMTRDQLLEALGAKAAA
ncbi:Ku protein [Streptomyces sp. NPDC091268]|uniref:non-homologous end joining protein Ku n=1 Tax=Streptomyces sp. NPDC091268 TaxID=3365979 RepID=UPI0037F9D9EF